MIIIQDTREQNPWDFSFYDCDVKVKKLDTGDYSLEGLENIVCIERKQSTAEIAINLGQDKKRFEAELERMKIFKYKYLFFEFSIDTLLAFPRNSGIPRGQIKSVRMNSAFMIKVLQEYEVKYDIEIVYCNNPIKATEYAYDTLRDIYAKETAKHN